MRPVARGPWPTDENGDRLVFNPYNKARRDLIERLGEYCSFCETPILVHRHVEHKFPKDLAQYAHLEQEWDNFLLACSNCNSTKGFKDTGIELHLFPDTANTAMAFRYGVDGQVSIRQGLSADQQAAAQRTILLVGLNKTPSDNNLQATDYRWFHRREIWRKSETARLRLQRNRTPDAIDALIDLAIASGYWSIWMTIFADDLQIRERLVGAFRGTALDCFDENWSLVARPNSLI